MGRLAVRQAVQALIQTANIPYVGTVFAARPTIIQEQDYEQYMFAMNTIAVQESANGSACVIVVNIPTDKRVRQASQGNNWIEDSWMHPIALELFFASTGGKAVEAQLDYDSIVDNLTILIRNNPTLNAPQTIWAAATFETGITHTQTEAYSVAESTTVLINGVMGFDAWEWESGQNV